MEVDHFRN